jgi:DNA processing protein
LVSEKLKYQIGLTLIKGVGPVLARNLVAYVGDEEAVFREKSASLRKIPGIGAAVAHEITSSKVLQRAEHEIKFIEAKRITPLFFSDSLYPQRLLNCDDAPVILYSKGVQNYNVPKIISVVGTRKMSDEGRHNCENLITQLGVDFPDMLIVSGLAYGVDICAHKTAIKANLNTVGVLAHGLDRIYPPMHRPTAVEMLERGGLLSEFMSETEPDKPNFVKRNRIIAGMADAVVVIESGEKGGALITARLASSYNRDVLAFPGRVSDPLSAGCHWLIKKNLAALVENSRDLADALGWEIAPSVNGAVQKTLFPEFETAEEQAVYQILLSERDTDINTLCLLLKMPVSKISAILLGFEFAGIVRSLPGNRYKLM